VIVAEKDVAVIYVEVAIGNVFAVGLSGTEI